jgi:hypothetical protein
MTVATTATNVVLGFGAILLTLRTVRWRGHIRAKEPASARSSNP